MKHLTKSTKWMIGSLTFAVTLTSLAQNTSGQERLLTQNDVANKLQQYSVESEGMSIRPADASLVWSAAEQFKGKNVSLDLPKSGDALASNSVLVGSGSDGLVSDNNLEKKGTQYILNPPLTPKTSITLVGRLNDHDSRDNITKRYCVVRLSTLKKENFKCMNLNSSFKAQVGEYLLNYNGMNIKVSVQENENKIIYLREIYVPKQAKPIRYFLRTHPNDSEQIKNILYISKMLQISCSINIFTETYRLHGRWSPSDDTEYYHVFGSNKNKCLEAKESILNQSIKPHDFYEILNRDIRISFEYGRDNDFISVLPGIYNVEWIIDGDENIITEIKID